MRVSTASIALSLFVVLFDPSASFAQPQTDFTLARGRIGALRIGMTADEVVALFGAQRVKKVGLYTENPDPEPALEVRLGSISASKPSLTVELHPGNTVYRVQVFDKRYKTTDGLGIGSTLGQIRARHELKVGVGEGSVFASSDELGLSFDFSQFYPSLNIPARGRVQSILVF